MAKMNNKKIGAEGQASGNTIPLLSQFSIVIVKTEKEQQIFVCVKLDGRHLWQSSGKLLCGGRKYSKSIVLYPPCGCNLTIDIITASCISMSHTIRPQSSCIRRCHHAWSTAISISRPCLMSDPLLIALWARHRPRDLRFLKSLPKARPWLAAGRRTGLKKSSLGSSHKKGIRIEGYFEARIDSADKFGLGKSCHNFIKQRQSKAYFVHSFMLTVSELMVTGAVHTIDKFMTVMHDLH